MPISDWSTKKFIVYPQTRLVILTDYRYWVEHERELGDWCQKNNCLFNGMTVEAKDNSSLTLFLLRWA
jgi:hypothetical protein